MSDPIPLVIANIQLVIAKADPEKSSALAVALFNALATHNGGAHPGDVVLAALARINATCAEVFSQSAAVKAQALNITNAIIPTRDEALMSICAHARVLGSVPHGDAPLPWRSHIHEPGRA